MEARTPSDRKVTFPGDNYSTVADGMVGDNCANVIDTIVEMVTVGDIIGMAETVGNTIGGMVPMVARKRLQSPARPHS